MLKRPGDVLVQDCGALAIAALCKGADERERDIVTGARGVFAVAAAVARQWPDRKPNQYCGMEEMCVKFVHWGSEARAQLEEAGGKKFLVEMENRAKLDTLNKLGTMDTKLNKILELLSHHRGSPGSPGA